MGEGIKTAIMPKHFKYPVYNIFQENANMNKV